MADPKLRDGRDVSRVNRLAPRVINDLNLRLAASKLAFMVDNYECTALLADDYHLETGRELMDSCPSLRRLVYIGYQPGVTPGRGRLGEAA